MGASPLWPPSSVLSWASFLFLMASTAPREQTPCLIPLPPPNRVFANTRSPQGPPCQKEVLEEEPDPAWPVGGLPEDTQT